jgi:hypothetical protein
VTAPRVAGFFSSQENSQLQMQTQIPFGDDNKKRKDNSKDKS